MPPLSLRQLLISLEQQCHPHCNALKWRALVQPVHGPVEFVMEGHWLLWHHKESQRWASSWPCQNRSMNPWPPPAFLIAYSKKAPCRRPSIPKIVRNSDQKLWLSPYSYVSPARLAANWTAWFSISFHDSRSMASAVASLCHAVVFLPGSIAPPRSGPRRPSSCLVTGVVGEDLVSSRCATDRPVGADSRSCGRCLSSSPRAHRARSACRGRL
jgi:hypothetical protein